MTQHIRRLTLKRIPAQLALIAGATLSGLTFAADIEDQTRKAAAAEVQAEAAIQSAKVAGDVASAAQQTARRAELDAMAQQTLSDLFEANASAASNYADAYGYAVFEGTKGGLVVTGAGGSGVAASRDGNERVYMHMGAAGLGLGAGAQGFELVVLFEDRDTFDRFAAGQWNTNTSAQAAAGTDGVNAASTFVDGMVVYQLTSKGLIAQVDVTGTRFWPSATLNGPTES